jgi:hypothetical protein
MAQLLVCVFLFYLPFVFFGYGADSDSYAVIYSGSQLMQRGSLIPSRYPGYLVHEVPTAVLNALGGSVATNLGSLVMAIIALFQFGKVCKCLKINNYDLLILLIAANPVYMAAATYTIDFVWALALFLTGFHWYLRARYLAAGVVFGLAVGARLCTFILVLSILGAEVALRRLSWTKVRAIALCCFVAGTCYWYSFVHASHTMGFLTYSIGNWSVWGHLARLVYKLLYLFGLQSVLALVVLAVLLRREFRKNWSGINQYVIILSGFAASGTLYMFYKVPVKVFYLLPLLFVLSFALGVVDVRRPVLKTLIAIQLSYMFVSLNVARPDVESHATRGQMGLWIEEGFAIKNVRERLVWGVRRGMW